MNMMTPIFHQDAKPMDTMTLASRAMLVSISVSQWAGFRLDRDATGELNQSKGAAADASRVNKRLVPKEALSGIDKIVGETRAEFYRRSLPWTDKGTRIIRSEAFIEFSRWLSGQRSAFDREVDGFLRQYPSLAAAATARMGQLYDADDYPAVEDLRQRFAITSSIMPVPTANDFRVEMDADQADMIRRQIERDVTAAANAAIADVFRRMEDVVRRMAETLPRYRPAARGRKAEGIFRDSLVENVRDLIAVLPNLNLTGDRRITEMSDRLQRLATFDAATLRTDAGKRRDIAEEAAAILDDIGDFIA